MNASRHTLWQARIANKLGNSTAAQLGNAPENNPWAIKGIKSFANVSFASRSLADQSADLLNNQIGRRIGRQNPTAAMNDLAIEVLNEFSQQGLWVVTASNGQFSISRQKLTVQQTSNALSILQTLDAEGFNPAEAAARQQKMKEQEEVRKFKEMMGPKW